MFGREVSVETLSEAERLRAEVLAEKAAAKKTKVIPVELAEQPVAETAKDLDQAERGRMGGHSRSPKKVAAAKRNAKLGGRPRANNPSPRALKMREYRQRNKKNANY